MTSVSTVRPPGNRPAQALPNSLLRCGYVESLDMRGAGGRIRRTGGRNGIAINLRCRCVFHPLDVIDVVGGPLAPCGHPVAANPPQAISSDMARQLVESQDLALIPTDAVTRWKSQVDGRLREMTPEQRAQALAAVAATPQVRTNSEAAWAWAALCEVLGHCYALQWLEETVRTLNCPHCRGEGEVRSEAWGGYETWLARSQREYPDAAAEAHYRYYAANNGPEYVPCECRGEQGAPNE